MQVFSMISTLIKKPGGLFAQMLGVRNDENLHLYATIPQTQHFIALTSNTSLKILQDKICKKNNML